MYIINYYILYLFNYYIIFISYIIYYRYAGYTIIYE